MKNIISILGWVFAVLTLFALATVIKHTQALEQALDKNAQTPTTREEVGAPTIQKHLQQNANAQISTHQLFKIKKCGKVQDFETEAWAKDFLSKITKITKDQIREVCVIYNFKDRKEFLVAIASEKYCSLGTIFKYDISSTKLDKTSYRRPFVDLSRNGEPCYGTLVKFKQAIVDGYMLPVISAFGDAGVYIESLYYYDLLHNALFYIKDTKEESSI